MKLLPLIFAAFCLLSPVAAGGTDSFTDHFNSQDLNPVWDIKSRNGGYFINDWADSSLVLVSEKVEEGVYLNYAREIGDQDAAIEVRIDTSYLTDNISIGFADQVMVPDDNEEVNSHLLADISVVGNGWWTYPDDGLKEGKFQKGWHIFSLKIDDKFIETSVDGNYIGRKTRRPGPAYFCISGDAYTNYYTAKVIIDYIKINYGK